MVDRAKEKIKDNEWQGVSAEVINQDNVSSLENEDFTHILTGLGINFCKDADAVLQCKLGVEGM
jgi:ubiquinone/menaquinone biosynthesis C-methylase UbiE